VKVGGVDHGDASLAEELLLAEGVGHLRHLKRLPAVPLEGHHAATPCRYVRMVCKIRG
jgi:hypothetical protein